MIGSPPGIDQSLARASELLQEGKLDEAAAACDAVLACIPHQPNATHLLGLARGRSGATAEAEQLLRRSLVLEPANHQFRVNFGNFLRRLGRFQEAEAEYRAVLTQHPEARKARHQLALTLDDLGRRAEAEAECRRLIEQDPRDSEAWLLLGFVLRNQQRRLEAEVAYRRSLAIAPNYGLAHHNLGSVLVQMERAEEALEVLARAEAAGVPAVELRFSRARALMFLDRLDEAEREYERATLERPRHLDAQLHLVRLRFMRADPFFTRSLEQAVRAAPEDRALSAVFANVLFLTGRYGQAESTIRDLLKRYGPLPQFRAMLAQVMFETGRLKEAETEALEAAAALPRDANTVELLVSVLLSRGRPAEAMPFILTKRAQDPLNQSWIAHEATAARLLGQPQYRSLFDYGRFVRVYRPEPPKGWRSMQELNAALLEVLAKRHPFAAHPLEQSLRNGSQTTRNLVLDPDPVIQAVLRSFEAPLQHYLEELGSHPEHPFLKRNRRMAHIAEGWSVQLRRDGFHVNHVHPRGWISSSYYVAVPEEVTDTLARPGWLKLGEPRYPVPSVTPDFMVQPQAGQLVLYPSYVWHGTTPIHGDAPRTTIAFDALPG